MQKPGTISPVPRRLKTGSNLLPTTTVRGQEDVAALVYPISTLTTYLLGQLSRLSSSGLPQQTILDLGFLYRTLLHLARILHEQRLHDEHLAQLYRRLTAIRHDLEHFSATTSAGQVRSLSSETMGNVLAAHLTDINNVLSLVRFWTPSPAPLMYYTGTMLVGRLHGADRYEIGCKSTLDDPSNIPEPDWTHQLVIFEHVGMKSGGERYYDPFFFGRGVENARQFFISGRVFMMLWSVKDYPPEIVSTIDEEPGFAADRHAMMVTEGIYTGPFEGPTTFRCFVVVKPGARSCLCLPISSLSGFGCAKQPDQYNYGIIRKQQQQDSSPRSDEPGMYRSPLTIQETPQRQPPITKFQLADIPPPELLPTGPLPMRARIDYRRWCEVELNVYCRNVGLVEAQALMANIRNVGRTGQPGPVARMDADIMMDG